MCPIKLEVGILVMVEAPQIPAVGVMTLGAIRSQPGLVYVVIHMALQALLAGGFELLRQMTIITGDNGMQAGERKATHVMVKTQFRCPARGAVTAGAVLVCLPLVHIVQLVAGNTLSRRFLFIQLTFVTADTGHLVMLAQQPVFGITVMVEAGLAPLVKAMTGLTFNTVTPLMFIVFFVA